jgi:hypothetical protein
MERCTPRVVLDVELRETTPRIERFVAVFFRSRERALEELERFR